MDGQSQSVWNGLETHTDWALLGAGVLLAGVAVYKGVGDFTSMTVPSVVDTGYGGLALLSPILGLLGIYSRVRAAAPRTATIGVMNATLPVVFVLAVWMEFFGSALALGRFPRVPEEVPAWGAIALVLTFLTLSLGFILLGIASRRSHQVPKPVGLLLLVPGLLWISLIVNVFTIQIPHYDFYTYILLAATLLTIGYQIRAHPDSGQPLNPRRDSAA